MNKRRVFRAAILTFVTIVVLSYMASQVVAPNTLQALRPEPPVIVTTPSRVWYPAR